MQLKLIPLLFLVWLNLNIGCRGAQSGPNTVPYRVLYTLEGYPAGSVAAGYGITYVVSVDQLLPIEDVKKLICQIVRDKNPPMYERLFIGVYHQLEEYIPAVGDSPVLTRIQNKHRLADYMWSTVNDKNPGRLSMTKDAEGNPLEIWRPSDFDHKKSCN